MDNNKDVVRCPKCASVDVRYSYTQTTWDLLLDLLFSMDAFRCRSCRHRFHKFDPRGPEDEDFAARTVARRQRERQDDLSHS
jgi:DNA-directed RNA polymerase subunit RPC12/RpoP